MKQGNIPIVYLPTGNLTCKFKVTKTARGRKTTIDCYYLTQLAGENIIHKTNYIGMT